MTTTTPDMTMVPIYNFIDASGAVVGCGTEAELDYWTAEGIMDGVTLGAIVTHQMAA